MKRFSVRTCRVGGGLTFSSVVWAFVFFVSTVPLGAAEGASSVRQRISERLKVEFPYKPEAGRSGGETDSGDVVAMSPFIVEEKPDHTRRVAKVLEERRQQALDRKPSLEGGASIDTDRIIVGPRPRPDLFKEDGRFKTDKAITPQWSLLDFRM